MGVCIFRWVFPLALITLFSVQPSLGVYGNSVASGFRDSVRQIVDQVDQSNRPGSETTCGPKGSPIEIPCTHHSKEFLRKAYNKNFVTQYSPYTNCVREVYSPFESAEELATYYESNPATALKISGGPTQQLCDGYKPRRGFFGRPDEPDWEAKEKLLVAEFYESGHRLQNAITDQLQEIASMDSLTKPQGSELLEDVHCPFLGTPDLRESCNKIKSPSCKALDQKAQFQEDTTEDLEWYLHNEKERKKVEGEVRAWARGRHAKEGMSPQELAARSRLGELNGIRDQVLAGQPALKDKAFKNLISGNSEPSSENIEKALSKHFQKKKEALLKKTNSMIKELDCLKGTRPEKECKKLDEVPPKSRGLLSDSIIPPEGKRTREDLSLSLSMKNAQCMKDVQSDTDELNSFLLETGIMTGLTVATLGIGMTAGGARALYLARTGTLSSKASRAAKYFSRAIKTKRGRLMYSILGVDSGFLTDSATKAYGACIDNNPELFEKVNATEPTGDLQCPEGIGTERYEMRKQLKNCGLYLAMTAVEGLTLGMGAVLTRNISSNPLLNDMVDANIADGTLELAEATVGKLSNKKALGVFVAHLVGRGEPGRVPGTLAGKRNYTDKQLGKKIKVLEEHGFTNAEARRLIRSGAVGAENLSDGTTKALADEWDRITNDILAFSESKRYPDAEKAALFRMFEACQKDLCDEVPNTRRLIQRLATSRKNDSAELSQLKSNMVARCRKSKNNICSEKEAEYFLSLLDACKKGNCSPESARQYNIFVTSAGRSSTNADDLPFPRPGNSLGREVSSNENVVYQNQLVNGLHRMDGEQHLAMSLDPVHLHREGSLVGDHMGSMAQSTYRDLYNGIGGPPLRRFVSGNRLGKLMDSLGLSRRRSPDLWLDGQIYDIYTPELGPRLISSKLARKISSTVLKKVEVLRQTNRVIVDISDIPAAGTANYLRRELTNTRNNLVNTLAGKQKIKINDLTIAVSKVGDEPTRESFKEAVLREISIDGGLAGATADDVALGKVTREWVTRSDGSRYEAFKFSMDVRRPAQNIEEVTVILGSRTNPIPMQIYPYFDEDAFQQFLRQEVP